MGKKEFSDIRRRLGKTQRQLAQLLGTSPKAIQSFEQGWRKIPVHTERQILFLLGLKKSPRQNNKPCWAILGCSAEVKGNCPAWEFRAGHLCWFINGTICHGQIQGSWQKKMRICRQCKLFRNMVSL